MNRFDDAMICHKKAIELNNTYYAAYNSLGSACLSTGKLDEARDAFQQAITIRPDFEKALNNLGLVNMSSGQFEQAIDQFKLAIAADSDYAMAHNNLANAYQALNQHKQAIEHLEKAVSLNPDNAGIINNLGVAYRHEAEYQKALQSYSNALAIDPEYADVFKNMAIAYQDLCRIDDAIDSFKKALSIKPEMHDAWSGLLFCLNYKTDLEETYIYEQHKNWAKSLTTFNQASNITHRLNPDAGSRLRIGYLSPDFRSHSVAFFIEPVLKNHNQEEFEIFALHDSIIKDAVTQRLIEITEHWLDVGMLGDSDLAELIKHHKFDILIDLAGHTANNRMPMLANRLAPIQINYLGYCNTTGLNTMDYRITDAKADPEEKTEQYHTEKLLRLNNGFLCYLPPKQSPEIDTLPVEKKHILTLGCFNNASKINSHVISVWSDILKNIPDARIILKARQFKDLELVAHFRSLFSLEDIAPERIEFLSWAENAYDHLNLYNRVDIAVDTFPYNGTTTTCEALWMGVPVVSLVGKAHRSRVGLSLLSRVDLEKVCAASSEQDYVNKVLQLSEDLEYLSELRSGLRSKVAASTLTDDSGFTSNLEYMYSNLCRNKSADIN